METCGRCSKHDRIDTCRNARQEVRHITGMWVGDEDTERNRTAPLRCAPSTAHYAAIRTTQRSTVRIVSVSMVKSRQTRDRGDQGRYPRGRSVLKWLTYAASPG
jgi:hypothetical protein